MIFELGTSFIRQQNILTMQLTSFDRWLREKFALETHVQVLRLPNHIPSGVQVVELPEIAGRRFNYLFIVKNTRIADELFSILKDESMMYNTQIIQRDKWYVRFIAPKNRSVSWTLVSWTIIMAIMAVITYGVIRLLKNPEIRDDLMEAIEILKG